MKTYKELTREDIKLEEAAADKHWMASFSGIDFWVKNVGTEKTRENRDDVSEMLYDEIAKTIDKIMKKKKLNIKHSDIKTITVEFKK